MRNKDLGIVGFFLCSMFGTDVVAQTVTYERCSPIISGADTVEVNCTVEAGVSSVATLAQALQPGLTQAWIEQEFGVHRMVGFCGQPIYEQSGLNVAISYKNGIVDGYSLQVIQDGLIAVNLENGGSLDGFGFYSFPQSTLAEIFRLYTERFEVPCSAFAHHGNAGGEASLFCSTEGLTGAARRNAHAGLPERISFDWGFEFPSATFDHLSEDAQSSITSSFSSFWNDDGAEETYDHWSMQPTYLETFIQQLGHVPVNRISVGSPPWD
ncbi:hypothetical protein IWQ55_001354 [Labrenzia sp. EL_208]|nr:hypothetical protein [Labrenzia sp. EL_132]MBG6228156.1 hypothetical protein [Labrenzia sp. EL_208]